jgi:Flp pilus assembly protein TadB
MQMRVYRFGTKNRAATIALIAAALAAGAVLIAFGLVLLLALAAAATVIGAGTVLYYRLTGRRPAFQRFQTRERLDPSLEVFPDQLQRGARPSPPARSDPGRIDAGE